jgi:hypothetical protein
MIRGECGFRTSTSVRTKWKTVIENYAKSNDIKTSEIISILLEKQIEKMSKNPKSANRTMKYQQRGLGYQNMHLRLSPVLYGRLRDVMCLFRVTLAVLLSMAMESFDEIMRLAKKGVCYPPSCHSTIVTFAEDVRIFANYWGIPPGEHTITVPPG